MAQDKQPVEQVLHGLQIGTLPEGWTPIDGAFMIKCLDKDGRAVWAARRTEGINDEEMLGALVMQIELHKRDMLSDWVDEDE